MTMHFFKTYAMDHCRREENAFFSTFASSQTRTAKFQAFRDAHERLGIDLDEFERQMASYQLSGDPTVLLTMGERAIRELGRAPYSGRGVCGSSWSAVAAATAFRPLSMRESGQNSRCRRSRSNPCTIVV